MTVKRFGYGLLDDDLQESPVGPYVRWDDYERLRTALQDIFDWYMDDKNSASGDRGGHALEVTSAVLDSSTVDR